VESAVIWGSYITFLMIPVVVVFRMRPVSYFLGLSGMRPIKKRVPLTLRGSLPEQVVKEN